MIILVSLHGTEILRLITVDLCNIKIENLNLLFILQDSLYLLLPGPGNQAAGRFLIQLLLFLNFKV